MDSIWCILKHPSWPLWRCNLAWWFWIIKETQLFNLLRPSNDQVSIAFSFSQIVIENHRALFHCRTSKFNLHMSIAELFLATKASGALESSSLKIPKAYKDSTSPKISSLFYLRPKIHSLCKVASTS